jgi:hypothetical protein
VGTGQALIRDIAKKPEQQRLVAKVLNATASVDQRGETISKLCGDGVI